MTAKYFHGFLRLIMLGLTSACLGLPMVHGQESTGQTVAVGAFIGPVDYSRPGATVYTTLQEGMALPEGATIRTGRGAALDLDLGKPCGRIRLTENTIVKLSQLGGGLTPGEWQLEVKTGIVVGSGNQVEKLSQLRFKTPVGIVGVSCTKYRVDARGYLVAMDNLMVLAQSVDGKVQSHLMEAPPVVYFAPGYGIQEAPAPLVNEVEGQINTPIRTESTRSAIPSKTSRPVSRTQRTGSSSLLNSSGLPERRSPRKF